jgi:hypothetical protein
MITWLTYWQVVSLLKCPKLLDHYRYGTAGVGEGHPLLIVR